MRGGTDGTSQEIAFDLGFFLGVPRLSGLFNPLTGISQKLATMFTGRQSQSVNICNDLVELEEEFVGETRLDNVAKMDIVLAEVGIVVHL